MIIVKHDLARDLPMLEVHTLADLHMGDRLCDTRLIQQHLQEIESNSAAYVIVNGDIINNATKSSVSDSYSEMLPPMEQLDRAIQLLAPIRDKILCMNDGNHENRTYRMDGIQLMRIVAQQLGIEDRYSPEGSLIFIRFGAGEKKEHRNPKRRRKLCYTIYATHGSGGGRKVGGKANRLSDLSGIVDADIYVHSHTHLPMIFKEGYFRVNPISSKVSKVDKLFVNTAATLDYGGYGESAGYTPTSKDTPVIYLDGTKKKMWARL